MAGGIDLYTYTTPNGWKASVALEEMGLPYDVHVVDLSKGEQKEPWYVELNPNARIPTIVDRDEGDFVVFESGAILLWLADKSGKLLPTETKARSRVLQWLMFQMGGVGPMMGQANVFYRYHPKKIPEAIHRYQAECRRLFEVLDRRLGESEYLGGDEYTIADIANWCWVYTYKWSGISVDGLDNLNRWRYAIRGRPAVDRGIKVPYDVSNVLQGRDDEAAEQFAEGARSMVTGIDYGGEDDG